MPRRRPAIVYLAATLVLLFVYFQSAKNSYFEPKCEKVKKVAYLKTHKCASTTVQNILLRFALENELNVVLPASGNYLGRDRKYQRFMIGNTPWERAGLEYNIFCLHTIWNQDEVNKTLGEGAVYITMLRDPIDVFESLWNYAAMHTFYHMSLEKFARSPKKGLLSQRAFGILGRNQMLHDMGLTEKSMDNIELVDRKIEQVDQGFDLVLIAERFQESIVLMKDELCWDVSDVVNLKLNARQEHRKSSLSDEARQALEEYLEADYRLYNHFKNKFNKRMIEYGEKNMNQELAKLNKENKKTKATCDLQEVKNENLEGESKLWGKGVLGYVANSDLPVCRYMSMAEMSLLDYIRKIQTARANLTNPTSIQDEPEENNKLPQPNTGLNVAPFSLQNQEGLMGNKFIKTADMEKIKLMLKGVQPFSRG